VAVLLALAVLAAAAVSGCAGGQAEAGVLRLGYFPNLTHAQALYGVSTGLYQEKLGGTHLETQLFNAGPTAFESLLAGRVDVIYVGPSPTISALDKKGLDVVVIVSGSASGGASFVAKGGIDSPDDLHGKRLGTPQLGNTQDIALKHWMKDNGLEPRSAGGDVDIVNAQNADLLASFQSGSLDGAWVPEPWATRMVQEAGGHVLVDEADLWEDGQFVTTHVVTTRSYLQTHGDDVRNLLAAHAEATKRLQQGGAEVLDAVNDGLEAATGKRVADGTLAAAMPRIEFTDDPLRDTFLKQYEMSRDLGFVTSVPDVSRVYDLSYLPATG
jgi:NitT/TauT family transport system substrate-binding protein